MHNTNLPVAIILGLSTLSFISMLIAVRRSDRDKKRLLDEYQRRQSKYKKP